MANLQIPFPGRDAADRRGLDADSVGSTTDRSRYEPCDEEMG
ncbi:MAG: hypothetical protein ACE367_14625 [Acidimicrobiales bacterium]|jgi:hypothetical protein